jgi:hypothetical protein
MLLKRSKAANRQQTIHGDKMKKPLTEKTLRALIKNEAAKFGKPEEVEGIEKDTDEVEADEYASTLAKPIDMLSALKIEESRLLRRLKVVRESKAKCLQSIVREAKKVK